MAALTLEDEVLTLRKENTGLRNEVKALRNENEELRGQQKRLISRETWPAIVADVEEFDVMGNNITRGYTSNEIIIALKCEFKAPYDDTDAKCLLSRAGFNSDDVREMVNMGFSSGHWFPMQWFSRYGDLLMCQWLYANGAAGDISRASNNHGIFLTIMGMTPMHYACEGGHLSVCEWLFEMGADQDISKTNHHGETPMLLACQQGHLSVCEWLFKMGRTESITEADNDGETPMHWACGNGNLSVCEWLFNVGADQDISRANNDGATPMLSACERGHLRVGEWLVLRGALNDPDSAGQHITQAMVVRSTPTFCSRRSHLLTWAQGVLATNKSFHNSVLMGTFSPDTATSAAAAAPAPTPPLSPLSKLSGVAGALELVADFLGGVLRGRELRNTREFAECLVAIGVAAVELNESE